MYTLIALATAAYVALAPASVTVQSVNQVIYVDSIFCDDLPTFEAFDLYHSYLSANQLPAIQLNNFNRKTVGGPQCQHLQQHVLLERYGDRYKSPVHTPLVDLWVIYVRVPQTDLPPHAWPLQVGLGTSYTFGRETREAAYHAEVFPTSSPKWRVECQPDKQEEFRAYLKTLPSKSSGIKAVAEFNKRQPKGAVCHLKYNLKMFV